MQQKPIPGLKENLNRGTKTFPCAVYQILPEKPGTVVKHHWHDEAEILYFSGGEYHLDINMETYEIHSECFFFINPGELHHITCLSPENHTENAIVFNTGILRFDNMDAAQLQIISPLISGSIRFPRTLSRMDPAFSDLFLTFRDIMHALSFHMTAAEQGNYEALANSSTSQLYLKAGLLRILAILSSNHLFQETVPGYDKHTESIKAALTFIQENYQEKIHIQDLAKLVGMNEQYFCRFFKKALGSSPVEYINDYRIRKSLHLLEKTSLPITEVCLESGFNNLGNFMREFKKHMQTTPLRYRKMKNHSE